MFVHSKVVFILPRQTDKNIKSAQLIHFTNTEQYDSVAETFDSEPQPLPFCGFSQRKKDHRQVSFMRKKLKTDASWVRSMDESQLCTYISRFFSTGKYFERDCSAFNRSHNWWGSLWVRPWAFFKDWCRHGVSIHMFVSDMTKIWLCELIFVFKRDAVFKSEK